MISDWGGGGKLRDAYTKNSPARRWVSEPALLFLRNPSLLVWCTCCVVVGCSFGLFQTQPTPRAVVSSPLNRTLQCALAGIVSPFTPERLYRFDIITVCETTYLSSPSAGWLPFGSVYSRGRYSTMAGLDKHSWSPHKAQVRKLAVNFGLGIYQCVSGLKSANGHQQASSSSLDFLALLAPHFAFVSSMFFVSTTLVFSTAVPDRVCNIRASCWSFRIGREREREKGGRGRVKKE